MSELASAAIGDAHLRLADRVGGETADTCPRCSQLTLASDFETDPRWGRVCDRCHRALTNEHGEPKR